MANPQPDKFTKWSNELLEAIIQYPFTANEYAVMLFIGRNTYGYGEKTINLRVSKIAEGSNISKKVISRVLRSLLSSSCILYHQVEGKTGVTIGIQKDYDKWKQRKKEKKNTIKLRVKHHQVEGKTKIIPSSIKEKRNKTNKGGNNSDLPKLEDLKSKFPWLDISSWSEFRDHRLNLFKKTKRHPFNSLAETKALNKLKSFIDLGYKQSEILDPSIISGWAGIFKPKEEPKRELGDF